MAGSAKDISEAIAVDANEDVFFIGRTFSTDFPTQDVSGTTDYYQDLLNGNGSSNNDDAFIVKLSSDGTDQLWATYFGGTGRDFSRSLVLSSNSIYLVGYTYDGTNIPFPTSSTGYIQSNNGGSFSSNGFIARFNKSSFAHQWSTFFGGTGIEEIHDCAIDNSGNLIIVGNASSLGTNSCVPVAGMFPLCNPGGSAFVEDNHGNGDVFIAKFNSNNDLIWSTQYGGSGYEINNPSIVADADGSIYVAGGTLSNDFYPFVTSSDNYFQNPGGGRDGYLIKFLNSGERVWATTYGGGAFEFIYDIAIDSKGDIYFTGHTTSDDFPIKTRGGSYNQTQLNQGDNTYYNDVFIVWINKDLKRLWSTYFGGTSYDYPGGIAVNVGTNALIVSGYTNSTEAQQFPLKNLPGTVDYYDGTYNGGQYDPFFADFNIGCNPCARMAGSQVTEEQEEQISYSEKNGIILYPNPAKSIVYVEFPLETPGSSAITIYNNLGMMVFNKIIRADYTNQSIPVELNGLAKGLYFFQISNNAQTVIQKIIVE